MKYPLIKSIILLFLTISQTDLYSQGFIVPDDRSEPAPKLIEHTVDISINRQLADVKVEQIFFNSSQSKLNGIFYFPLPRDMVVSNFKLSVGKPYSEGDLLGPEETQQTYATLLAEKFDPTFLDISDTRVFFGKVSIHSEKRQKVKLEFKELADDEHGLFKFTYPLHKIAASNPEWNFQGGNGGDVLSEGDEIFETINLRIQSKISIKSIYSPTHTIKVIRKNNHSAEVSCKLSNSKHEQDFTLYYSLDEKELGVSLIAQRPNSTEDGYFALLVSPDTQIPRNKILPKNLIFALDVSGSMAGKKMSQAKTALKYCINHLNKDDYFNIIAFSSELKLFDKHLVKASDKREQALEFINQLTPKGGTNINEALLTALAMNGGGDNSKNIVFITDGLPTVGVTDITTIREHVKRLNRKHYRIFNFGIGYNVNTHLLDGVSHDNLATATYIEPHENIARQISVFFERINNPVLSALQMDFGGIDVYDMYPDMLPDLFEGTQLVVLGRYKKWGRTIVTLSGRMAMKRDTLACDMIFPGVTKNNDYVARLWAMRKVGNLLEQINLVGESNELKEQIVTLSKKFGLITPYTCYLIREESDMNREPLLAELSSDLTSGVGDGYFDAALTEMVGRKAVVYSKSSQTLKEAMNVDWVRSSKLRYINGRTLVFDNGFWTDLEYRTTDNCLQLQLKSNAYLNLLKTYPETGKFLALGPKVIFKFKHRFLKVAQEGVEKLSEKEIRQYFD